MRGQRLYEQVVNKITALIGAGEYPAGIRLPTEREMAERFGVSRPTVRQAIIALEAQGRVSVKAGGGVCVLGRRSVKLELDENITPMEIIESRVLIEGEAAALAAPLIAADQLHSLSQVLEQLAHHDEGGRESKAADRQFHSIVAEATRNKELKSIIQALWDAQERMPHFKKAHVHLEPQARELRHREIMEALINRDPEAARTSMRAHFIPLLEALHETIEEEAMSDIHREFSVTRQRFSLSRLATPGVVDAAV